MVKKLKKPISPRRLKLKKPALFEGIYTRGFIFIIPTLLFLTLIVIGFVYEGSQQFSLLAQSFVHGHLYFLKPIGGAGQDPVYYHGKVYWDEGPFPSVLLLPFVWFFGLFHLFYYQGYLKWLLMLLVLFFIYRIGRALKFSKEDSLLFAFAFTLGSVFIGVASASVSWYFAQVVNTVLMFWAFYEYFYRRRWWLIGIICGFILMTRVTAVPVILFFILEGWALKPTLKREISRLAQLSIPVFVAACLIGIYNFLRFHNPLNGGYEYQYMYQSSIDSENLGLFSIVHIPTNVASFLLRMPTPVLRSQISWVLKFPFMGNNTYGLSVFLTSPYMIFVIVQKWASFDRRCWNLIIAASISALLVFSYFGVGVVQFGYRYSLDFLPTLFILFMLLYRKQHDQLTRGMRSLFVMSGVLNFYLLWQLLF